MDDRLIRSAMSLLAENDRDADAWECLYKTLYPYIFASLFRIFRGNVFFAEEAAQEAMLRLLKNFNFRAKNVGPAVLTSYVKHTIHSAALDLLRGRKRSREVELTSGTNDEGDAYLAESTEAAELLRIDLYNAIKALSDRDGQVARSLLSGRSIEEVADDLNVTIKTAYNLSANVRRKIKAILFQESGKTI